MAKTFTVQDFFKMFPTDDACLDHLMAVRYGNPLDCPKCGRHGRFHRLKKEPAFSCQWCGHHIHPMAGTPFERTRTALQKWFYAMYLFTTSRHGVPAKELQRQLGVTYKTAWRMGHEIRKYMALVDGNPPLTGHVEIDETYVGGRVKGKGRGLKTENKTVVLGMIERNGRATTFVIDAARRRLIWPHIRQNISRTARLSTDDNAVYAALRQYGWDHDSVNHSLGEYVRGDVHTNTIEGFWSWFKRAISGTHVAVSGKHMAKYLGEFEYRFNMRRRPAEMFDRLLQAF